MGLNGQENGFKVVPANKYYRFNQKNRYQTLSIDEAEAKMNKSIIVPRWFMKKEIKENSHEEYPSGPLYRLRTVASQAKSEFNVKLNGVYYGDDCINVLRKIVMVMRNWTLMKSLQMMRRHRLSRGMRRTIESWRKELSEKCDQRIHWAMIINI